MKPKLYMSRRIPQIAIDNLREVFQVKLNPFERPATREELLQEVKDVDALVCQLVDNVDKEVIDAASNLKVISSYSVGYNNIDVDYATSRGIAVCNTAGVLTESTADLTWALIMATCRRITESEAYLRAGNFVAWEPLLMLGMDVYNKTLGILGMGRIGQAVAKRALGFGMKLIYHSRDINPKDLPFAATQVTLETLLRESDILTLHVPLTSQTRHLIGKDQLAMMKPTAVLINTARGAIVDEPQLIKALAEKRIFGAGFDVYEQEPFIPKELLALNNVVLLPHIGSATIATRTNMGIMAAQNAIAIISGLQPPSQINVLP
ncbi:MAG: D-glycerate dehydrogenase [Candidatus Cloacimonetes bacterium]|nr:D-glycerate dehydrogenase [Candidatus Cloacimonadota bacterium]